MDSFTLNKIAGGFLGTCLLGMGLGVLGEFIYSPSTPAKPGYVLPELKPEAAGGAPEAKAADVPLPALLAKADPKKGEADTKVCGACHNFAEGAGAKVGPDLYGVVGRPKGSAPGFEYSAGLKAKGGDWTFADINEFITKPSAYVQGTKMGYPGEENPEKRADIISYLRTLSKSPVPLPAVAAAAPAAAAPAPVAAPVPAPAAPAAKAAPAPVPPVVPPAPPAAAPAPVAAPVPPTHKAEDDSSPPEPYSSADPQYPPAAEAPVQAAAPPATPPDEPGSSPPEPYSSADPQYPSPADK